MHEDYFELLRVTEFRDAQFWELQLALTDEQRELEHAFPEGMPDLFTLAFTVLSSPGALRDYQRFLESARRGEEIVSDAHVREQLEDLLPPRHFALEKISEDTYQLKNLGVPEAQRNKGGGNAE